MQANTDKLAELLDAMEVALKNSNQIEAQKSVDDLEDWIENTSEKTKDATISSWQEIEAEYNEAISEIEAQKELLTANLTAIETLKLYIDDHELELTRKDLMYMKLSLVEIKAYRGLYIDTFNTIKDNFNAYDMPYDQLSDLEQTEFIQFATDVITYRLVLLEKVNLELESIIQIVETYKG